MSHSLIRALPLVASALGHKYGVRVIIGADRTSSNGRDIFLPELPLDSTPELTSLARGYLDHEAAHIRATDFGIAKAACLSPLQHNIWNMIEDWRVEEILGAKYPGCRENFQWLLKHFFDQESVGNDGPENILNWILLTLRSWSVPELQPRADDLAHKLETDTPGVLGLLLPIMSRIRDKCPNTRAAIKYAIEIVDVLNRLSESKPDRRDMKLPGPKSAPDDRSKYSPTSGQNSGQNSEPSNEADRGNNCEHEHEPDNPGANGEPDDESGSQNGRTKGEKPTPEADRQRGISRDEANHPLAAQSGNGSGHTEGAGEQSAHQPSRQPSRQPSQSTISALKSLLAKDEKELPKSLGALLESGLNEASGKGSDGYLSVAVEVSKELPRLSDNCLKESKKATAAMKARLQNLLQTMTLKNSGPGHHGRLDTKAVHKLFSHNPKIFRRGRVRVALDTAIHLLVDASDSMSRLMELANQTTYALCDSLCGVSGVNMAVTQFPGLRSSDFRTKQLHCHTVVPVLKYGQALHQQFTMQTTGSTPMGEALWWVIQEMAPLRESRKIVIIVTDGMPNSIENTKTAIAEAGRLGLELYGLGLGNDAIKTLLPGRSVILYNLMELPRGLFKLLGEALKFNR